MYKLLILAVFIAMGVVLQLSGLLDPGELIAIARQYADYWWMPVILVLLQVLLFTFALAGTVFLWLWFPPPVHHAGNTRCILL